jgi:hypothetical protein
MATGLGERNNTGGFNFVRRQSSSKPWNTQMNDFSVNGVFYKTIEKKTKEQFFCGGVH